MSRPRSSRRATPQRQRDGKRHREEGRARQLFTMQPCGCGRGLSGLMKGALRDWSQTGPQLRIRRSGQIWLIACGGVFICWLFLGLFIFFYAASNKECDILLVWMSREKKILCVSKINRWKLWSGAAMWNTLSELCLQQLIIYTWNINMFDIHYVNISLEAAVSNFFFFKVICHDFVFNISFGNT